MRCDDDVAAEMYWADGHPGGYTPGHRPLLGRTEEALPPERHIARAPPRGLRRRPQGEAPPLRAPLE